MQKCRPRDHLGTVAAEGEEALGGAAGEEGLGGVRRRRRSAPEKEAVGELLGSVAAALLGSDGDEGEATAGRSVARRRKLGQRRSEEEDCALKYTRGPLVPVRITNRDMLVIRTETKGQPFNPGSWLEPGLKATFSPGSIHQPGLNVFLVFFIYLCLQ